MAVELARARPEARFEADPDVARLRAAVDVGALVKVGYDPERQVFAPGAGHPIFGFGECVVANCTTVAVHVNGLCGPCWRRWRAPRSGALALEEFVAIPRLQVELGRKQQLMCRVCCVRGFERPAAGPHGLCLACAHSYYRSGVAAVDEWIAGGQHPPGRRTPRPPAQPRPTYGRCDRCGRLAARPRPARSRTAPMSIA